MSIKGCWGLFDCMGTLIQVYTEIGKATKKLHRLPSGYYLSELVIRKKTQ